MGLDILLVRVKGRKQDGTLDINYCGDEFNWDRTRYTCRNEFLDKVEFDVLSSGVYMDDVTLYRPNNFTNARSFAETTDAPDYINKILDILEQDQSLYLEISV